MASDPRVDLTFSLFRPRYIQTGVDPFDLERIVMRIDRWEDWCAIWSDEARQHEKPAEQALAHGRDISAAEAYLRAAIYYHYGKHNFLVDEDQYRRAHNSMLRCYSAAALGIDPPMERLEVPFEAGLLAAYLRRPRGVDRPPVAVIFPGLDACKEELHAWSDSFLRRGMATVTLDGPGQGTSVTRFGHSPPTGWPNTFETYVAITATRPA